MAMQDGQRQWCIDEGFGHASYEVRSAACNEAQYRMDTNKCIPETLMSQWREMPLAGVMGTAAGFAVGMVTKLAAMIGSLMWG